MFCLQGSDYWDQRHQLRSNVVSVCLFVCLFNTGSHSMGQANFKLTIQFHLTSNSWRPSCFGFSHAGILGNSHHYVSLKKKNEPKIEFVKKRFQCRFKCKQEEIEGREKGRERGGFKKLKHETIIDRCLRVSVCMHAIYYLMD